jgi:O-antigen/teichoic acid export membrane protein
VLPLLLVSVTGLLGTMLTPYLSHDWELGGRLAVSRRMNMTLKLLSICLMLGATAILLTAPLLFASAFRGKFQSGLAVLPWTLTYCVWFGIARVAQKYLWCAERVGLAAMAWLAGLLLNVGLNFLLLPRFGLSGVVWSTAAGNLTSLLFLYGINRALGMRFERATWVLSAAPLLLAFGPWAACCGCGLILLSAAATPWLFHSSEKQQLLDVGRDYQFRLRAWFGGRSRRKEFSGT